MKFKDKIALITGASRGIGKAIAIAFANEGACVVIIDIDLNKANEVTKVIKDVGLKAISIKANVSNSNEVRNMVKETVKNFGRIDILVNNAGIQTVAPFLELTEEEWDEIFKVNLKGTFLCSQMVAKEMIKFKKGKIINISSIHYSIPRSNKAHYDASKAGIEILTKDMALELAKYKINVNCIAPGAIATPMNEDILNSPEKLAKINTKIPLKRMGKPDDISKVAIFLASDDADYITGVTICVDGGLSLA